MRWVTRLIALFAYLVSTHILTLPSFLVQLQLGKSMEWFDPLVLARLYLFSPELFLVYGTVCTCAVLVAPSVLTLKSDQCSIWFVHLLIFRDYWKRADVLKEFCQCWYFLSRCLLGEFGWLSRVRGRGSRVRGRGLEVEGRGSEVEGRKSRVASRGSRVACRGSRVACRGSRVIVRGWESWGRESVVKGQNITVCMFFIVLKNEIFVFSRVARLNRLTSAFVFSQQVPTKMLRSLQR